MVATEVNQLRERLEAISDPASVLANLIAFTPAALAVFSTDGRPVLTNSSFDDLFGKHPASGYDVRNDETFARLGILFRVRRAFAGETVTTPTFWFERREAGDSPERSRVALSARAFPILGRSDAIEFIAIVFRDETDAMLLDERHRAEADELRRLITANQRSDQERRANEELFRAIFEQCSDGVMITDDSACTIDVNPAGCRIVGRSRENILGAPFWRHMEDRSKTRRLSEQLLREGRIAAEVRVRSADGSLRELEIRSVANFLPGRHLTTFHDVTERNRAEKALAESRQHLQLIIDSVPVGIAYVDTEHRHVFVNRAYAHRLGCRVEDLVGRHVRDMWGDDLYQTIGPALDTTISGEAVEVEVEVKQEGRPPFHARAFNVADVDDRGAARGVVSVIADVTRLRRGEERLRASQAHLVASQRIAHVGSWEFDVRRMDDLDTNRLRASDECYRIFGYEPGDIEITTSKFFSLVHRDDREGLVAAIREAVEKRSVYAYEHRIVRRDGAERIVYSRAEILYDDATGEPLRLVGTTQDISERVRVREQVQRLNAELEQRVAERTIELAEANRDLEAFAYSVSHDLRAPLRAINGYAQIVLHEHPESIRDEARHALARIETSARRMDKLIDDLLSFSRLGRQTMHARTVSSRPIVEEVLDELGVYSGIGDVEVVVRDLPACHADPGLLKQVFANLIGNAVKFSRSRRPARIEIGCNGGDDREVFYVRDNGVGFDMKHAGKLFGVFQRLHSAERYEGTGVGLALVERIVKRHGGSIWAEAATSRGACFFFTLAPAPDAAVPARST